jgi:putative aldouronate transport system permease protein
MLMPMDSERVFSYEAILNRDGTKVTETIVTIRTTDRRTTRQSTETFVLKDVMNESLGVLEKQLLPVSNYYDLRAFRRIEAVPETGTALEALTVGGTTYTYGVSDDGLQEILIYENSEIRRASDENVSRLGIDFSAYLEIFRQQRYMWSLAWTAMLTVACAIWSVFITAICAYPLTYDHLKGRKFFNTMIILTMYFGAGTIPTYILLNNLGLINHPLVLALPFCLSVFNMIIMRSYFYGIPLSLRESAELDGAGPIRTLVFVYVPLSMPVIATMLLFYAVGRWNGYSDAMIFMNRNERYFPIQYLLYLMLEGKVSPEVALMEADRQTGAAESLRMAMVMFAMVPILIVYPFLQRYFIAGVTLGAVKE